MYAISIGQKQNSPELTDCTNNCNFIRSSIVVIAIRSSTIIVQKWKINSLREWNNGSTDSAATISTKFTAEIANGKMLIEWLEFLSQHRCISFCFLKNNWSAVRITLLRLSSCRPFVQAEYFNYAKRNAKSFFDSFTQTTVICWTQ